MPDAPKDDLPKPVDPDTTKPVAPAPAPAAKPVVGADVLKAENQPGQTDAPEADSTADKPKKAPKLPPMADRIAALELAAGIRYDAEPDA